MEIFKRRLKDGDCENLRSLIDTYLTVICSNSLESDLDGRHYFDMPIELCSHKLYPDKGIVLKIDIIDHIETKNYEDIIDLSIVEKDKSEHHNNRLTFSVPYEHKIESIDIYAFEYKCESPYEDTIDVEDILIFNFYDKSPILMNFSGTDFTKKCELIIEEKVILDFLKNVNKSVIQHKRTIK